MPLPSVSVLCGAVLAFVAGRAITPVLDAAEGQSLTHLAKVQALGLESVTEGSNVVYYSKGSEPRARAVLAMVGGFLGRFNPVYGQVALRVDVHSEPDR